MSLFLDDMIVYISDLKSPQRKSKLINTYNEETEYKINPRKISSKWTEKEIMETGNNPFHNSFKYIKYGMSLNKLIKGFYDKIFKSLKKLKKI